MVRFLKIILHGCACLFPSRQCGVCPVFDQCAPGGIISPETCVYFPHWWAEDQPGAADGAGADGMDYEGGYGLSAGGGGVGSRAEDDEAYGSAPAADVEDIISEDSS